MSDSWFLLGGLAGQDLDNSRVLSLHPAVSYQLSSQGIPYKIFNDYCAEEKLRVDEDEFFKEQLLWLEQLDEFIQNNVPGADGVKGLGQIHINRLKYLIDFVIIQTRYLERFLDRERPRKIVLVESAWEMPERLSLYDFKHPLRQSLRPLLEYEAAKRGFELETQMLSAQTVTAGNFQLPKGAGFKRLAESIGAKVWLEKIRYGPLFNSARAAQKPVYLFLDAGTEAIDFLIRQAAKRGRVFIKQGLEIHEPGKNKIYSLKSAEALGIEKSEVLWQRFESSPLMKWIENYAPASREILKPYFSDFLSQGLSAVLNEMRKVKRFMMDQKVSAVISRASAGINYPAVLLTAGKIGIPRICFQHSIGPLDMSSWAADELAFHDMNFAMHPSSRDYFRAHFIFFDNRCRVESWSYSLKRRAATPRSKRKKSEVVFYVPAKLAGGAAHFNTPIYPMTWYFEHQKKILRYFSQRPDFEFIYKHSDPQVWAGESVLPWLADQKFPNVRVADGVFPKLMHLADRVIFDYPSSGTFESAAAKVPMLALHHKTMRVWEPMRSFFGPSLKPFSDSEQAVSRIHDFLNTSAMEYTVNLPWEKEMDPLKLIESFKVCSKQAGVYESNSG